LRNSCQLVRDVVYVRPTARRGDAVHERHLPASECESHAYTLYIPYIDLEGLELPLSGLLPGESDKVCTLNSYIHVCTHILIYLAIRCTVVPSLFGMLDPLLGLIHTCLPQRRLCHRGYHTTNMRDHFCPSTERSTTHKCTTTTKLTRTYLLELAVRHGDDDLPPVVTLEVHLLQNLKRQCPK